MYVRLSSLTLCVRKRCRRRGCKSMKQVRPTRGGWCPGRILYGGRRDWRRGRGCCSLLPAPRSLLYGGGVQQSLTIVLQSAQQAVHHFGLHRPLFPEPLQLAADRLQVAQLPGHEAREAPAAPVAAVAAGRRRPPAEGARLARFFAAAAENGGQQRPDPVADERDEHQEDCYREQHEQHQRQIDHDPNLRMLGAASPQV